MALHFELQGEFHWRDVRDRRIHTNTSLPTNMTHSSLILDTPNPHESPYLAVCVEVETGAIGSYMMPAHPGKRGIWLLYYTPTREENIKRLIEQGLGETLKDLVLVRYGSGL